jgi:hypothetical protein
MSGRDVWFRHDVARESGDPMEERNTITRRHMLERGAGVLGAGTVALAGVTLATAGPAGASEHETDDRLVGSWRTTTTSVLGVAHELFMFSPGGGVVETVTGTQAAAIGTWEKVGESTFRATFHRFQFDQTGVFSGELISLGTFVVDETGDSITGDQKIVILNTQGNVVFRFSVSQVGQRLRIPSQLP